LLSWRFFIQVNGDLGGILIPWQTQAKKRREQDRNEVLDCVGSYAKARMAELITVGGDEVPDDFLGFVFLCFFYCFFSDSICAATSSRRPGPVSI
jgi:hypothetical protein